MGPRESAESKRARKLERRRAAEEQNDATENMAETSTAFFRRRYSSPFSLFNMLRPRG